jgi:hypothetical protein
LIPIKRASGKAVFSKKSLRLSLLYVTHAPLVWSKQGTCKTTRERLRRQPRRCVTRDMKTDTLQAPSRSREIHRRVVDSISQTKEQHPSSHTPDQLLAMSWLPKITHITLHDTMMNLLQRRIRHGASIISLLALLPFFIIAQETGKLEIMNCFKKSPVQVSSIYLTCDSSGAYYYGKSSYRGSSTCKYGDIARIKAYCKCESVNVYVTKFSMPILGAPLLT